MDTENQVDTLDQGQEQPLDRKELLAQQFDAVEAGEDPAPQANNRDPAGRFTKTKEPVAEEPVEQPAWSKPPASWKKEYHDYWHKADPKLREYAWQREEQMKRGVEPLLSKAQFADAMNEALEPYMATIRGLGMTPDKAVAALAQADHTLRTSAPEQKMQYFLQLAQSYGINLGQMAPQQGQQGAAQYDPMVYQLQNELNAMRGEVMGWKQQQEMQQNQQLLTEINDFSLKAEHFEDARPTMIQLLQSGVAETLDDAYEKAIRLDSELFERVQSASQAQVAAKQAAQKDRAAKTARAAAVSVRGSTPGTNTASKAQSRRSLLEEAFSDLEQRL